jgi:hypothetical protein
MSTGDVINSSISGPNVYVSFRAQNGLAGADVASVTTSGWHHVRTIYRDPTDDYANNVPQQAATGGMGDGPGGGAPPSGDARPTDGMALIDGAASPLRQCRRCVETCPVRHPYRDR